MSISLRLHGLYSPCNSPGQNTGVGSLSLLQGIFPTQGLNPGLPHCRQILYQLSHKGSPRILEWGGYPFSRGSSKPGIEPRYPALQADSLPAEPQGKLNITGVGSLYLLQWIFLTQGLNLCLLHWQADSLPLSHLGNPLSTDRKTQTSNVLGSDLYIYLYIYVLLTIFYFCSHFIFFQRLLLI